MQADQQIRAWINRARRAVIGKADHEPVVEIEGAPRGSRTAARVRVVAGRWARTAAAFVATLALFGLVYGASVAWRERVVMPLDPPPAAAPETGAKAVAAAAMLLALDRIDPAHETWFTPESRGRRAQEMQAGAAEAVASFIEVVERRRPGRDKDLSLAAAALAQEADRQAYAEAREALRRFNTRAGRKGPSTDRGQRALAALARAAEAGVAGHQRALEAMLKTAKGGPLTNDAEAEFYRVRGYLYAWRILIGAYGEDLPPKRRARMNGQIEAARAALAAGADFEPMFLVTPFVGKGGPLEILTRKVSGAGPVLHALADAAEAPR